jgi:nucleotide-binding universal stress UspA family protein
MIRGEIKNILLALDESGESNKGLDKAIFIAKLSGAKITGVNVVVVAPTLVSTVINYRKFLSKKAQAMLDSTKKTCEKQEIQFASKVLQGSPASKIAEFAEKGKFDLVIIGSRGLGGIKGAILGSVANSVVHKSKVSVLVVK